jgi:phage terminase large subunit-like protein
MPATFPEMAASPKLFRESLIIDHDGKPTPFKPDPFQQETFAILDPAWLSVAGYGAEKPGIIRRCWIERGRGASKTGDLAVMLAWGLMFAKGPVKMIAAAGDADQARLLKAAIESLVRLNLWLKQVLSVQADKVANDKNGAELAIISSDVQTSFGLLPDVVIVDELCHWPEGRGQSLWESLFSSVGKRGNALLIAASNAGFTESWQWPLREQIRSDPDWTFCRFEGFPSWLSEKTIAGQRRTLPPLVFDRLWSNRWSSGSGDALQPADIDRSLVLEGPTAGWESGYVFYVGVDLGISRDHTGVVVVGKRHDGLLRVCRVMSWKPPPGGKVDLQLVQDFCLEMHKRFNSPQFFIDEWQAEKMRQDLVKIGVRMEGVSFSGKVRMELASSLIENFSGGTIVCYNDPDLVSDLKRLRIKEGPSGYYLDSDRTAKGGHADRATALALACLAARRSPPMSTSTELPVPFGGPSWLGLQQYGGASYIDEMGRRRELSTFEADEYGYPDVGGFGALGRRPFQD